MTLLGSMNIDSPETDRDIVKIFLNGLLKPLRDQINSELMTDPAITLPRALLSWLIEDDLYLSPAQNMLINGRCESGLSTIDAACGRLSVHPPGDHTHQIQASVLLTHICFLI